MFTLICLFTLFTSTVFAILSGALRGGMIATANECEALCGNVTGSKCSRSEALIYSHVQWTNFTGLFLTVITSMHGASSFEMTLFNSSATATASKCLDFKMIYAPFFEPLFGIAPTGYDEGLNWLCAPVCLQESNNGSIGANLSYTGPCLTANGTRQGTPSASSLLACARPTMISDSVLWWFKLILAVINTFLFTPLRIFVVSLPRWVRRAPAQC
jgi:hypothetical protein